MPWPGHAAGALEILFRPENVELASSPENAFTGTVAASFFLGDRNRVLVDGIGEDQITLETSNLVALNEGDTISFRIDSDSCVVL